MNSLPSPTSASNAATCSRNAARRCPPSKRNGSATAENMLMRGSSAACGFWNTTCTCRRNAPRSASRARVISVPAKRTQPSDTSTRRRNERSTVVLPDPDSPTRPSVSPSCSTRSTPSTARWAPKRTVTASAASRGIMRRGRRRDGGRHSGAGPRGGRPALPEGNADGSGSRAADSVTRGCCRECPAAGDPDGPGRAPRPAGRAYRDGAGPRAGRRWEHPR